MRAEASLSRTDATLNALFAYYDVVLAERRIEVLSQSVANLDEAARVLVKREAAGTVSGYESTRLAIASQLVQSQLSEAHGLLEIAKARLAPLIDLPAHSLRVRVDLSLISSDQGATLAESKGQSRPGVQQARESHRLASEAEDRASWAWLPTLELGAGLKRASNFNAESGYGYAVGVSLDVPLFDRGQAERAQAQAQRALASARSDALTRTTERDVAIALATFRSARQELERFDAHTSAQVEALLTAAKSGYLEGERTIVELLDAQRAETEVAERSLTLLGTAKRAEAQLRAATGDLK
jgi:cobalt-zinc-cadmium efflux system outer membrane protein